MKTSELIIRHPVGLHARPASLFVETAKKFNSKINVIYNEEIAFANSILDLLRLGITKDSVILISADGNDENEAVEALSNLVNNNFFE